MTVHAEEYIDYVEQLANEIPGSFTTYLSADTQVEREMLEANKLIVGAGLMATELARERGLPVYTFGGLHHAGPSRGGGFCVLNDVAAAAQHALDLGVEKVLVLDTDAHAGDGTMDIFYENPRVLFVSVHHDPSSFYPGRGFIEELGDGEGTGYTVNFPMPPFAGIKCYEIFWEEVLEPIVGEFAPDLIIRNGGSDPYVSDLQNLGYATYLGLTKRDLYTVGRWTGSLCEKLGTMYVDVMGSGYNVAAIPSCWYSMMMGSLGLPLEIEEEPVPDSVDDQARVSRTSEISAQLRELLKPHWTCLT
jgi:acetoin utilization protein AcuC